MEKENRKLLGLWVVFLLVLYFTMSIKFNHITLGYDLLMVGTIPFVVVRCRLTHSIDDRSICRLGYGILLGTNFILFMVFVALEVADVLIKNEILLHNNMLVRECVWLVIWMWIVSMVPIGKPSELIIKACVCVLFVLFGDIVFHEWVQFLPFARKEYILFVWSIVIIIVLAVYTWRKIKKEFLNDNIMDM